MGQLIESWSTVTTRWGSLKPLSAKETTYANQVKGLAEFEIQLRFESSLNLTSKDRIKFGTRIFNIQSVINENEQKKMFIIRATEEV